MDTAISHDIITARRNKMIVIIAIAVVAIGGAVWLLRSGMKSSVDASEITTSVVETGTIDNTLNASGEVIPEFEQVISSPINASINEVVRDAGSVVKAGDVIVSLDKEATQADYERLKFQLESKRNSRVQIQYEMPDESFTIRADEQQLEQALINIVQNSMEAIETEGKIIIISHPVTRTLTIIDSGSGISSEHSEHLFSPFFSTKKTGQGVGLTLVKRSY